MVMRDKRCVTQVLMDVGVDMLIYTPHSTSAAAQDHVPLDTILKTAGWSRDLTFRKYYKKPVAEEGQFGQALLELVNKSNP